MLTERYWAEHALLPDGLAADVAFEIDGGVFTAVTPDSPRAGTVLPGVVLPGFANGHSHAFHRALRGRTHADGGTFWTWRERMYAVAARLDPDSYLALARATYAEMALAGVTAVGEFHYVHHAPGGRPYADPYAMGHALQPGRGRGRDPAHAARHLLPDGRASTPPLAEPQLRFSDGDVDAWAARAAHGPADGVAVHSVRAVPRARAEARSATAAARPAAARPPLRAARGERGLPGRVRRHPDRPARRGGRARPGHHRRARHPPDRRRHHAAGPLRHRRLLLPDHRARSRRRHRPGPRAARGGRAAERWAATSTR